MAKPPALDQIGSGSMPFSPQPDFCGSRKLQSTKPGRRQTIHIVQAPAASEKATFLASAPSTPMAAEPQSPLGPAANCVSLPSRPAARSLYERRHASGTALTPLTVSSPRSASDSMYLVRGRQSCALSTTPTEPILSVHELRSGSGMALHTNTSALRRYTDYNEDGSPRFSEFHAKDDAATAVPLFSRSTVRAVLDDPCARQHLYDYMRRQGGAENMDFLAKVEEYTKALQNVTALVANLSTSFTSVAATTPLRLPCQLYKSLHSDIKHVSSSIIPGLHTLFNQATAHIEDRIVRDIYPAFVKHQFALHMKTALGAPLNNSGWAPSAPLPLRGLGSAFCLVDPYRADNAVVFASDAFASVLGYASANDVPRSGRLLKMPKLGENGTFSEGILLTHGRQGNEPFWSHVSVCPVASSSGRVRFLLVGLVDLSTAVRAQADLLQSLSVNNPVTHGASRNSTVSYTNTEKSPNTDSTAISSTLPSVFDATITPPSSAEPEPEPPFRTLSRMAWRLKKSSSSTKPLFHMFSRKRNTEATASSAVADESTAGGDAEAPATTSCLPTIDTTLPIGAESPDVVHQYFNKGLPVHAPFMLLQYVRGTEAGDQSPSFQRPASGRSHCSDFEPPLAASFSEPARLKIAFTSLPMLELLGIHAAAQDDVMYQDVFSVLSGLAGSPSITPAFCSTVHGSVAASSSASMDITIPLHNVLATATSEGDLRKLAVPGGAMQDGSVSGTGRRLRRFSELVLDRPKLEATCSGCLCRPSTGWRSRSPKTQWQRSSPERPTTGDWTGHSPENVRKLMSHWTPLKDADGSVAWVVLVLAPVVKQA